MSDRFKRLEQLEARIDELVSAVDWWRKECVRREEDAFSAGWTYATADTMRGHRTNEYVITKFRERKHHLSGPDLMKLSESGHQSGSSSASDNQERICLHAAHMKINPTPCPKCGETYKVLYGERVNTGQSSDGNEHATDEKKQ